MTQKVNPILNRQVQSNKSQVKSSKSKGNQAHDARRKQV